MAPHGLSWLHPRLRRALKSLDVGCGTGWVTWYFRRRYAALDLDVVGMDCSPVMLDEARRVAPADFRRGDVCALDHPDDTFDLVTTVYTLRNFPDLRRGVREMYRVTAPGGARRHPRRLPRFQPRDASGALPVARVHHALRRRPVHQRRQSVQVPQREHVDDTSGGCGGDVAGMRAEEVSYDEVHLRAAAKIVASEPKRAA